MSENGQDEVKLPHVAVIIATHNYGQWLLQAIASVLLQDYPNKSIWIYDDGSTDDTWEILEKLLTGERHETMLSDVIQNTPILAYTSKIGDTKLPAQGPSKSRNFLIKKADKAQYYAILDADDFWQQGKLSKSIMKLMENPGTIGAVYTDNFTLNVNTNNVSREFRESFDYNRLLQHNMVHSGCVINKLALDKVGIYDESLRVAEDYDLWLRIAERFMIYHLPEPLVTIRAGNHNTSNSVPQEVWKQCWAKVYQKVQERNAKYNAN